MKFSGPSNVQIIDIYGNDKIGFKLPAAAKCEAYDAEGRFLSTVPLQQKSGFYWFDTVSKARKYIVTKINSLDRSKSGS